MNSPFPFPLVAGDGLLDVRGCGSALAMFGTAALGFDVPTGFCDGVGFVGADTTGGGTTTLSVAVVRARGATGAARAEGMRACADGSEVVAFTVAAGVSTCVRVRTTTAMTATRRNTPATLTSAAIATRERERERERGIARASDCCEENVSRAGIARAGCGDRDDSASSVIAVFDRTGIARGVFGPRSSCGALG